jgi:hypothetical protein
MKKLLLILALLVLPAIASAGTVSFADQGQYKMLYDARQRPLSMYLDGKVYIVWNGDCTPNVGETQSRPMAVTYDPVTREFSSEVSIDPSQSSTDHHKGPIIWADVDDYLHVLYACHNSSGKHRVSNSPKSIGTSSSDWTLIDDITDTMSYPTVFRYNNDTNQVCYYRFGGHDSGWTYKVSNAAGTSWKAPANVVCDLNSTGKLEWGSYHTNQLSTSGNQLHDVFVEYDDNKAGDPDRFYNPRYDTSINWKYNVFYVKIDLDDDEVRNYAGTSVTTPIDYNEAHDKCLVFDTNWAGTETQPVMAIDANDKPHFLHVYSEDTTTEYGYYYIRNVASNWVSTRITAANHERNSPYLKIDDDGTLHAYLVVGPWPDLGSMDGHGGGDIEEWISTDEGYTWALHRDLTPDSTQYPSWLFSNPQPVVEPNGTAVDGMLLFYGWLDPEDREAEAFMVHGTALFSDGFEDCFTNWTTTGTCSNTSYTGAKSLEMDNTEYATASVSTAGYSGLSVRYVVDTNDMSAGDSFTSEWSDGSNWHNLETISSGFTGWTAKEFDITDANAEDNADFELRFKVDNSSGHYAYVDDVEILYEDYNDTNAPTPDPMTWATEPNATGGSSIAMVATIASDLSGVEYYFANVTDANHDSGWQASTSFQDTGLAPSTEYTYAVKARDLSSNHNETAYSTTASATTTADANTTIFEDGFEDCFTNWTNGGAYCSSTCYEGAKSAKFDNTEYIIGSISTSGYTDITVKYVLDTSDMQAGDSFTSEWSDGSNWHNLETISSGFTGWTAKEFPITDANAEDNADFEIRFKVDNASSDFAFVDAVEVTAGGGDGPSPDPNMYVYDITMASYEGKTNYYYATTTIWIKDDNDANVSGATVTGEWTDAVTKGDEEGDTGADGKITLTSDDVKGGGTFVFTVTNVSATGYVYNSALNNETSDSITAP